MTGSPHESPCIGPTHTSRDPTAPPNTGWLETGPGNRLLPQTGQDGDLQAHDALKLTRFLFGRLLAY